MKGNYKKILVLFVILILIICCLFGFVTGCSCGALSRMITCSNNKVEYQFMNEKSEIVAIEIVEVGERYIENNVAVGPPELKTVCSVSQMEEFIGELLKVDCYKNYGDPTGIYQDTVAIKISYSNGDYELIEANGQAEYKYNKDYQQYKGAYMFDKDEFELLINKFSPST